MSKRHRSSQRVRRVAGLMGCVGGLAAWAGPAAAQVLPANPDPTCVVSQSDFNSWFQTQPGRNQPVKAADSVGLNTSNNCSFYKWSMQMFLWLTSPATGQYQGSRVFDSQIFYQVDNGNLVAQGLFLPRILATRATKFGPDGLPAGLNSKGHLREFVTAPSKVGLTATNALGGEGLADIAAVRTGSDGKAEFFDAAGKTVTVAPKVTADMLPQALGRLANLAPAAEGAAALGTASVRRRIAETLTAKHVLIRIETKRGPTFVEAGTGLIDDLAPGQAGTDGVLLSQKNLSQKSSVIFYEILVNDVYAWYLTGRKTTNGIAPPYSSGSPGLFPTSATDLQAVLNFSKAHGGPSTFPDANALAVEAKLSWVDATTLPNNGQGYILSLAIVPTYDTSNSTDWVPTTPRLAPVALVGAHIVGSANGHPEMVWSTFEHQANSPLASYQYNSANKTVSVPQNTSGTWLFSTNGAQPPYNSQLATFCGADAGCPAAQSGHIVSATSAPIGPSNDLRQKAWGVASNGVPNQEDTTPAAANTQIISLNTNVRAKLSAAGAGADPRFNYLFIGSTWTFGGDEPTCPFPKPTQTKACPYSKNNEIGTSLLANSTMETFVQGADTTFSTGTNCFDCHQSTGTNPNVKATTDVSHEFYKINPLSTFAQTK